MRKCLALLLCCNVVFASATTDPLSDEAAQTIAKVVEAAHTQFNTPGTAIAIVSADNVLLQEGFGTTSIDSTSPVTEDTYFRIGSLTKAFTALSVAQLVQEGAIQWDDKVIKYLPNFKMAEPYATENMTVMDLLTHRSGLAGGVGDSMLWPEPSGFSTKEIIHNLRFLTPSYSFRETYGYSNTLYITAAELVSRVTQRPWPSRIAETIFAPLKIDCFAGEVPQEIVDNAATPYAFSDQKGLYPVPRNAIQNRQLASAGAGGIVCNAKGMAKWLQFWLSSYTEQNESAVLDNTQHKTLWSPQTVMPISKLEREFNHTFIKAYAVGWRISNFYEQKLISHTGTISGFQSYIAILPDQGIGIVVLNNGSNYGARTAVMQTILRQFIPHDQNKDWVTTYAEYQAQRLAEYLAKHEVPEGSNSSSFTMNQLSGRYQSEWYGDIDIRIVDESLRFSSNKMPTLQGELQPFAHNRWKVIWDNQNAVSDALLDFSVNVGGEIESFIMTPFALTISDNHNWKDIVFTKVDDRE